MSVDAQLEQEPSVWLSELLTKQQKAFRKQPYASVDKRKQRLRLLKKLLLENRDEICAAISEDFNGRATTESLIIEMMPTILGINDAIRSLKRWSKPRRSMGPLLYQPVSAKVVPQPLGVVGVIAPWNYPIMLSIGPLITIFAAGNHALVKMSEFNPRFGKLLAELISKYFDDDIVTVVNGEADVAQAFSALPFDHLLFTGSTAVGRLVMRAASENLTPVTLELGGKSPVVIDRSIPVREAAERIVFPKCVNAGQTCVAPDYILCPTESVDDFVQHYLNESKRQFSEPATNDQYTSIINDRQRKRLLSLLEEATAAGAVVHVSGSDDLSSYGTKLPPIVVTNVTPDMRILEEEIFGPILPVVGYDTLNETIEFINDRPRPLALYVFGYDKKLRSLFTQNTHSGGLVFNDALIHVGMDNLPFGGVGDSGMGHYHGKYGFDTFSKLKPIVGKQRFSSLKLVYPPYKGWLMNGIISIFGR